MEGLVIVESPTKAKTIKGFLKERGYEVIASNGHIRDLPKKTIGLKDIDNRLEIKYEVSTDSKVLVNKIKDLAKKAKKIFIATDEDREGEAIGYHIAHILGEDIKSVPRITFHEITKKAIEYSIENPRNIDMSLVNAQQARRVLDRIVGYKLSPFLNSKIQKGLSAGRVQSSALKLIVDRENEIKAFKPEEFFIIDTILGSTEADISKFKDKKVGTIKERKLAEDIVNATKKEGFKVSSIEEKERKSKTVPPFMTSTLQQNASSVLGFSPKRTMVVAQKLYEGIKVADQTIGLITYMRTDSLNIAKEAIDEARDFVAKKFGKEYLPKQPKRYSNKSTNSQEAHEAIRPTTIDFTPEKASKYLKPEELKLYSLIYNRFISSQMEDAIFKIKNVFVANDEVEYKISGRVLLFDGFYRLTGINKEKNKIIPDFKNGDEIKLDSVKYEQKFTEPPARYSEATFIKTMESLGIGRPSTYAPTISLLQARKYISITNKQIVPEEISFRVIKVLEENFEDIVDSKFTASLEEKLDNIVESNSDWERMVYDFFKDFDAKINKAKIEVKSQKVTISTGEICPDCGKELVIKDSRYGKFIGCSGFPKCRHTKKIENSNSEEAAAVQKKEVKAVEGVSCPDCSGDIVERKSRRGLFYGCKNFPKCKFTSSYKPVAKKCPKCDYMMSERVYKKEEIYECIKCKERVPK